MEDHSLDEIRKTKRTVKNNVFIKLFEDVKNVYTLYCDLHPEDTAVKDLGLTSFICNDMYWRYHTEAIENAFEDITRLIEEKKSNEV